MIRIQQAPFDPAVELVALTENSLAAGAVAAFVGIVRPGNGDWQVERLELQQYEQFTKSAVETIAAEGRQRFGVIELTIIHRFGSLAPGEPIVFIAATADHRRAALEAIDYVMDRLKTEAPFWKREHGPAGSRWIEPRSEDQDDRARWDRC